MKALVYRGPRDVRVEEVPDPTLVRAAHRIGNDNGRNLGALAQPLRRRGLL